MKLADDITKIATTLETILTHLAEFSSIMNEIRTQYVAVKENPSLLTDPTEIATIEDLLNKVSPMITNTDPGMKQVLETVFNKMKQLQNR